MMRIIGLLISLGHTQHVCDDPQWQNRPWVLTEQRRKEKLGVMLQCKKCDDIPFTYEIYVYDYLKIARNRALFDL